MRFSSPWGHFELNPFPGSNQLVVASHAFIEPEHRGQGHGHDQAELRTRKAVELGYDFLIATVVSENDPQLRVFEKQAWECLTSYKNRVTGNTVHIMGLDLNEEG